MNKAILMSATPKECCNILNFIQSLFVRKKFPKYYRGWVYIYCTKGGRHLEYKQIPSTYLMGFDDSFEGFMVSRKRTEPEDYNGKVVARFWCDKVKYLVEDKFHEYYTEELEEDEILKKSCLTYSQLFNYLKGKVGYAVHISQLEIFDEPKELGDFYCNYTHKDLKKGVKTNYIKEPNILMKKLTKAPQNMVYIDVEE